MNAGLKEHGPIRCTNNRIHLALSSELPESIDNDKISLNLPYLGPNYPTSLTSIPDLTLIPGSEIQANAKAGAVLSWIDYLSVTYMDHGAVVTFNHNVTVASNEYVYLVFPNR